MLEKKRRSPTQARAAATVEAILEASFQILDAEGVAALTTNRIARRAGVSVGTLYQYFDSKEAILAALADLRAAQVRDEIARTVIEHPPEGSVRAIVRALMHSLPGSTATRGVLLGSLFSRGDAALVRHHEAFLAAIAGRARLDVELTPERAFVLTHAPIGLLRAATEEPSVGLDLARLEAELVRLMEAYLAALPRAPRHDRDRDRDEEED